MIRFICTFGFILFFTSSMGKNDKSKLPLVPLSMEKDIDGDILDRIKTMSTNEKVGQLFIIRAHSDLGPDHVEDVKRQIENYHVGGLCFFQGDPVTQARLTNTYQELSKTPLIVSIDAEWGLSMRFKKNVITYPRSLMLGAISKPDLIYDMGKEFARQLKRIGVNMNFAPVVDVNTNPLNPVINDRSFGEHTPRVTHLAQRYIEGMQDNGVMAVLKHFPGHGDTEVDSHLDLPIINHPLSRLNQTELYPFRKLAQGNVAAMMVAHLHVPSLDNRENLPTTLSEKVVTTLLRDEIGFEGLIITDGMEMKGVTKYYQPGEAAYKAFEAGNDMILLPDDMDKAFEFMISKIQDGSISQDMLDRRVYRILQTKKKYGLLDADAQLKLPLDGVIDDLNNGLAKQIKEDLIRESLTAVRVETKDWPLNPKSEPTLVLSIGKGESFAQQMRAHGFEHMISVPSKDVSSRGKELLLESKKSERVVIALHCGSRYARNNWGISQSSLDLIDKLSDKKEVILVLFGNPYALKHFDELNTVLCGYENDPSIQKAMANALVGKTSLKGRLPVTASSCSKLGDRATFTEDLALKKSTPKKCGFSKDSLAVIDELAEKMIRTKAAPGCQILIAKGGQIAYHKSFGRHTYDRRSPKVDKSTIYDLASITKTAATTLAVMKLYEQGIIDLDVPVGKYLDIPDTSNKYDLTLRTLLNHEAGLRPWIPFYQRTMQADSLDGGRSEDYYQSKANNTFNIKVAEDIFTLESYPDTVFETILQSDLDTTQGYVYSDLGLILTGMIVKEVTGKNLGAFVDSVFYGPMGLSTVGFRPTQRFKTNEIAPTEMDDYFRNQEIQGYVHDMTSAQLGGIAGHAGLFSNAEDLAKIYQMLLNGGIYEGKRYLGPETIMHFRQRYFNSRRGVGFDMKDLDPEKDKECNISELASHWTFGHYGFTGTAVWADPVHELIYVFLSNRTYPTMENRKLTEQGYRTKIQSQIYKSFLPSRAESR